MEDKSLVDFAPQITLILSQHVIKGLLGVLGQVAGLKYACVSLNIKMSLLWAYHWFKKRRHAGLFLKSENDFLLVVSTRTNRCPSAFAGNVVDRPVVKSTVLTERALSRFRLAHVFEAI